MKFKNVGMITRNTEGKGVYELESEEQLIKMLNIRFASTETGLAAIIVKNQAEVDSLMCLFSESRNNLNNMLDAKINKNKWNVIKIENVKGLEFKSVIVLSGRMSENEKYIAYTRALDELIVYEKCLTC